MAKIIFWFSAALIFYVYAGYLGVWIIVGSIFNRRRVKKDIFPSVTLIIPAFNEEKVIKDKLENSLSLDYPQGKLEIVVCSESTDQTNSIVSTYAQKGVKLFTYRKRQGKSAMLYDAVPQTQGEIIVFSDANAIFAENALKELLNNFADARIGAVCGRLKIANPQESAVSWGEYLYKQYEGLLRKYNSRLLSVLGVDGSIFALRRTLYLPISPQRGDDFELAARILIKGFGVVFEPEAVSFEKAALSSAVEATRKIRIVSWFLRSALILLKEMLWPFKGLLIFQLVSHKILRWYSPGFFILLFFSSLVLSSSHILYALVFAVQVVFYLAGTVGWIIFEGSGRKSPAGLKLPFYFLVFNSAFLLGVLRGIFLKPKPFWEKSQR